MKKPKSFVQTVLLNGVPIRFVNLAMVKSIKFLDTVNLAKIINIFLENSGVDWLKLFFEICIWEI